MYRFVWLDGYLEIIRSDAKLDFAELIARGIDEVGMVPSGYVGGFLTDEGEALEVFRQGIAPSAEQIQYLVFDEMARFGREQSYRERVKLLSQSAIPTAITPEETRVLRQLAQGKTVLEIGALLGHSTVNLADIAERVYSIDPHEGYPTPESPPTYEPFINNLYDYNVREKVEVIPGRADEVMPRLDVSVDLVFIDASGSYYDTSDILEQSLSFLSPNGVIVVHDYNSDWVGVDLAVSEFAAKQGLEIEVVGSMAILGRHSDRATWEQTWTAATVEDTEPKYNFGFLTQPHESLYPAAFKNEKMRPEALKIMKAHVLNAIEKEIDNPDNFIYFTVFGSGASYNWDEDGDFDVQMWVDYQKFQEVNNNPEYTQDDLMTDIRRVTQTVNFPSFAELNLHTDDCSGNMLIQFYPKPGTGSEEENLASQPYACYDMETDKWLVKPEPITPEFYGDAFLLVLPKAEDVALQAEAMLSELNRDIVNWQFWRGMFNIDKDPEYERQFEEARTRAEQHKEGVANLFNNVFKGRQEAYSETGKGYKDERDFLQKLLEVWGIFQELKHFARAPLPWDEQELPAPEEDEIDTGDEEESEKDSKVSHTIKLAEWADVMDKARRYLAEGRVEMQVNAQDRAIATVHGDSGDYQTEIYRQDPQSNAITMWTCTCPWGEHSWGRTRQWKRYEGRPCAHATVLHWVSQTQPIDGYEEDYADMQNTQQAPTPGAPPASPMTQTAPEPMPDSHLKDIRELGPLEMPGTFSKVIVSFFNNGEKVRAHESMQGFDDRGESYIIPENMAGEVLWSDEDETIAIFPINSGRLEPHLVKVVGQTTDFYLDPNAQPFVKRRSHAIQSA